MFKTKRRGLSTDVLFRWALLFTVIFFNPWPVRGDQPRALLLGGYQNDCMIIRANNESTKPKPMMVLYSGDKVVQRSGVDGIVIKCSPFTSAKKLNETTLQISCQPPAEKKTVLKELQAFLGFEKDTHQRRTAGTRTLKDGATDVFVPQPGPWATVMPGDIVEFSCDRKGTKTIVFRDSSGARVFSKAFGEATSVKLTPQDIPMKPSETYSWEIEIAGVSRGREKYSLRLLGNEMAELVAIDLKKLGEEGLSDTERKLRTAAYCQFISDTYPQEADLYWKSYELLKGLDKAGSTAAENDLAQVLRDRCIQHIEEQIATGYKSNP